MAILAISGKSQSGKDTVAKIVQYLTHCKNDNTTYEEWCTLKTYNMCNWKIHKFADALKDIICILTGCSREQLEDNDFKNSYLPECWNKDWIGGYKMSYRTLLQTLGTDLLRNQLHEDVWVNALFSRYHTEYHSKLIRKQLDSEGRVVTYKHNDIFDSSNEDYPNWIISDCRFPNELKAVKDKGGISIRVNRDRILTFEDRPNYWIKESQYNAINNIVPHSSETALDNAEFDYVIDNNSNIEELIEQVKQILIKEQII